MSDRFWGFRRPDGSVGVRNHLLVLSLAGLTVPTARRIGSCIQGALVIGNPYGAGLLGHDRDVSERALRGFVTHPNVGAILLIGDNPPVMERMAAIAEATGKPFAALTMDDCDHDAITLTERGIRGGAALAHGLSRQRRSRASLSALSIGMECGRSDPSSGLVSNPLLGLVSDRLVAAGGRSMIGETTEWLGAEHLLARRAVSQEVGEAVRNAVLAREQMAVAAGIDLTGNNPGPTNIAAGLSSIEEKSLGNICKSGAAPVQGVLGYGEAPRGPGLWVMDGAAYSPESLTGFAVAGAQIMLFTTGVGNSFVNSLAPTIKVCANPVSARNLGQQVDYDASQVFSGARSLAAAASELFETLIDVASGSRTWGEILGEGDEVVSRYGAAL
ncbi:MAG: UxaA family hydrolase [Acetobacteraceae bacterium]